MKTSELKQIIKEIIINETEYKIFRDEPIERIKKIPENLNIVKYLQSVLFNKNGEYYFEDDNNKLIKINFKFEGSDILIYPDGKYKLLVKDVVKPNDIYCDISYPNEINKLSPHSPDIHPPFGYGQWIHNNEGKRWYDGNDAFIPLKKIQ